MSDNFDTFYGDLMLVRNRIKKAGLREATPAQVRGWEREAVSMIEGFEGVWSTYPLLADGQARPCTDDEADFLRKHHLALLGLDTAEALQVPGEDEMTRAEFERRLKDLDARFQWLDANAPPAFRDHVGPYTAQRRHVASELAALAPQGQTSKTRRAGCYVATAVYGSYDCAPVWTLRRYRDQRLLRSRRGQLLVHLYYATSPHLVRWFGGSRFLRAPARRVLDVLVARLQARGYEGTGYDDAPTTQRSPVVRWRLDP
jgi:hypothetical protein